MSQRGALPLFPSLCLGDSLSHTLTVSLSLSLSLTHSLSLSPSTKFQEKINKALVDKGFGWEKMEAKTSESDLPDQEVSSIRNPLACLPDVPNGTVAL
jgi:hypothetical protein